MSISLYARFSVLKRDRFTCVYCGAHPPNVELEIDHYFPQAMGGGDEIDNLVTACLACNRGKSATVIENGMPDADSPLWAWIRLGMNRENSRIRRELLERDDAETMADVVERLWPEADY